VKSKVIIVGTKVQRLPENSGWFQRAKPRIRFVLNVIACLAIPYIVYLLFTLITGG